MYTIGIVGYGTMGSAIAQRLAAEPSAFSVTVYDKDPAKLQSLHGIRVAADYDALLGLVETVIVAVKPQDFDQLLRDLQGKVAQKLIVTIAAGISTDYIERSLGKVRVVRIMPNLPAKLGKGMICLTKGLFASEDDMVQVENLFKQMGHTIVLTESMIDPATAIAGSGPGFFYYMLDHKKISRFDSEALEDFGKRNFFPQLFTAATSIGFDVEEAKILTLFTIDGALALLRSCETPINDLIHQIASKGGTTEAGLDVLKNGESLQQAVKAALERARCLSQRG